MDNYSSRLHKVIPGGAHTYSRGDDQFPSNAPAILSKGEGAYVFDADGRKFLDYGMGLRSVNIGYGNREIADACYDEILKGNNLTRASLTELKAAELFTSLIHSADMVKFAKHGSTVTTAAVKLARAYTGRKRILFPEEQPFFSFDDWFIGSTVMNKGVPEEISAMTHKFRYNDIESLRRVFTEYPNQVACVIMEAASTLKPGIDENGVNFVKQVQEECHRNGAIFILDEMITGFRWHLNGAQAYYDIDPDLSTFGKAMANGFAVAALAGKKEIMQLGSILTEGAERVFLTSTTHGAEMSALGAFIKTAQILERDNVVEHFWNYGTRLMDGMNNIARELGIQDSFYVEGYPCSPNYIAKDAEKKVSLAFRTLYAQEMVKENILMPYVAISFSHQEEELVYTLNAVRKALEVYKKALENGIDTFLESKIIKPVFRRLN